MNLLKWTHTAELEERGTVPVASHQFVLKVNLMCVCWFVCVCVGGSVFSTATSRCCPGPAQPCPRRRPRHRCPPTRPRCGLPASPAAPPAWRRLTSGSADLHQSWPPWYLRTDSTVLPNTAGTRPRRKAMDAETKGRDR